MKVGDRVVVEGEISMVGEGFCKVQFAKVGSHAVQHVRIWDELIQPAKTKAAKKTVD